MLSPTSTLIVVADRMGPSGSPFCMPFVPLRAGQAPSLLEAREWVSLCVCGSIAYHSCCWEPNVFTQLCCGDLPSFWGQITRPGNVKHNFRAHSCFRFMGVGLVCFVHSDCTKSHLISSDGNTSVFTSVWLPLLCDFIPCV